MPTPEEILSELLEITADLDAMGDEDPARDALTQRRLELREKARRSRLALSNPAALQNELGHLRRRLKVLDRERVQIPMWQKQIGGRLTDPEAAGAGINKRLDEANATERQSLEARIDAIETMFAGPASA